MTYYGHRSGSQRFTQCLSLEEFGDDKELSFEISNIENRDDIGVVQRAGGPHLLFKAAQQLAVAGELVAGEVMIQVGSGGLPNGKGGFSPKGT